MGFANTNLSLYPITVTENNVITFTGSVPDTNYEFVDVYFRFEDNDTFSYDTGTVTVSGSAENTYSIELNIDFNIDITSVIMYVVTRDVPVKITNVQIVVISGPIFTSSDTADSIDENSGAGQVIYTATVSSNISGGGITYSLKDSNGPFSIDQVSGDVSLMENPDYETENEYTFTVVATDDANNSSEKTVTVSINNLDEVAPEITSSDTADSIDENSGAGQVIYTATADDSGDDIFGPITFSLTGDSDSALSIDASTGEVTLTDNPDYESQSQYSFAVIATDGAGNASAAKSVTLDINDLDDTAPTITSSTANTIDENSGAGQIIYTASAVDTNDISDGVITYSLKDSNGPFSIDHVTGVVTLTDDPDYETENEYTFTVVATDGANNSRRKNCDCKH